MPNGSSSQVGAHNDAEADSMQGISAEETPTRVQGILDTLCAPWYLATSSPKGGAKIWHSWVERHTARVSTPPLPTSPTLTRCWRKTTFQESLGTFKVPKGVSILPHPFPSILKGTSFSLPLLTLPP